MVQNYARRWPEAELEVAFFHGGFPSRELMAAAHGLPMRLSCHPADLSRASAKKFAHAGGTTVELELMSLDPHVLRIAERQYTVGRVRTMVRQLKDMNLSVGVHLVPGLPGSDAAGAVADLCGLVDEAGPWVDFVRIWPALAFEGAKLATWADSGAWRPWDVGEAVGALVQMVAAADEAGLPVVRIGIQPGQDIPVRAVAGPDHPNMRGEVEVLRFGARIEQAVRNSNASLDPIMLVNPKDLSWAKGTSNSNAKMVRAKLGLRSIRFETDKTVPRGTVLVAGCSS
jgi:histone acetyltransferase (RNA polymerase elongator complex component)